MFILSASFAIQRHVRSDRPALNGMAFLFLTIFTTTLYMLVTGLLGWWRPLPILISSALGITAIWLSKPVRGSAGQLRRILLAAKTDLRQWWGGYPSWLRWLLVIASVLSAIRFVFLIWALPPFVWDSLSYHLTNVAHWTQVGRIETFEIPVIRIFNPANYEVFASWFTIFIHHDALVEAAGLPLYLLATVAVYASARGLGRSRTASVLGAFAYVSTPAVILAATGTKNDIHIAAYYLTAMALVIDLSARGPREYVTSSMWRLTLLVLVVMLAIGTKTYILHLLPGLAVIALLGYRRIDVWTNWTAHLRAASQELRSKAGSSCFLLFAMLASGLFLASFWNVRNWLVTDNPFYPYEVLIAGRSVFAGPESEFRLDVRELAANLENLADKFGDWRDPIRPDLPNTTGWGWFAYVIGLPALGWAVVRRPRIRPLVLGFTVSFLLVMLSTGPSPWNMRFVIWFPAVFALCFAELVDSLPSELPHWARPALVLFLVFLLNLNFIGTLNYNRVSAEEFREMLGLPVAERHTALFRDNMPEPYTSANQLVPPDATLGFNVTGNGFIYPLYRADYSQQIVYVPFLASDSCEIIAARMDARGTRYLLVAPEHTEDEKIAAMRRCAESGDIIRERARGLYVISR